MNSTYKTCILLWLLLFGIGQTLYHQNENRFVSSKGVYLDPNYKGMYYASVIYASHPKYVQLTRLSYHLGSVLLLPMMLLVVKRRQALTRTRDYSGNYIGKSEFVTIERNYRKYERRKVWRIKMRDRNQIWIGVDLLTGEDVYLEGEQIYRGILLIGGQGTGKTSRFFKVMVKQLAKDPKKMTSFLVFTLKGEDSLEFGRYLKQLGQKCIAWGMCNVLDLAMNRLGGLQKSVVHGLLQSAALATGLGGGKDPFWLNGSIARMVEHIMSLSQEQKPGTLGNAFTRFQEQVDAAGDDARMDQSLLETLNPVLGATTDAGTRVSILHSPNYGGGLHLGPLFTAAGSRFREITSNGTRDHQTGDAPKLYPHGLYEVPAGVRIPFDWYQLLKPLSVILPPPGKSKPELFALNLIKMSLLNWISEDIASTDSRLLRTDPANRHRIVLAQDEGHNFLALEPPDGGASISDTKALAENRQGGQVNIIATQSPSRLNRTTKEKLDDFLSVNANYIFLGVNGEEREKVLKIVGKVKVTRIKRSYGRSEDSSDRTISNKGSLKTASMRANVSEAIHNETTDFISSELYGQFSQGMAIHSTQGKPHRVIYCPLHARVQINTVPSWWSRLLGRKS